MAERSANSAPKRRRKPDWARRFLEVFRATCNVRLSADAAGIDRDTAYWRRQRDETFAARWAQAEQDAIDVLEAEARRRALSVSDTLLIFLLKAHRPARYRERFASDQREDETAALLLTQAATVARAVDMAPLALGMDDATRDLARRAIGQQLRVLDAEPAKLLT